MLLRFLLSFLFLFPTIVIADMDFLNFGNKEFSETKSEKGKWFLKSGLEYIRYRSTFPAYKGKHENIKKNEEEDIFGLGLYFGREFYFGAGLSSSLSLGAFYHKTLNKEIAKAAEDIDIEAASTRRGHQVLAYEALLSLNYMIDNKVIDVQPFIEGGLGLGSAKIEKQYERKPVPDANAAEAYDVVTEESFLYTKFSIGLNFVAFDGLTSYIKLSTTIMNISERTTTGDSEDFGTTASVNLDNKEKDLDETVNMTMASLGIGYMF